MQFKEIRVVDSRRTEHCPYCGSSQLECLTYDAIRCASCLREIPPEDVIIKKRRVLLPEHFYRT